MIKNSEVDFYLQILKFIAIVLLQGPVFLWIEIYFSTKTAKFLLN